MERCNLLRMQMAIGSGQRKKTLLTEMSTIEGLIQKYDNCVAKKDLEHWYKRKSVLQMASVPRDENVHSGYLAWILDDKESHGLGRYAFTQFLGMLFTTIKGQDKHPELIDDEQKFPGLGQAMEKENSRSQSRAPLQNKRMQAD